MVQQVDEKVSGADIADAAGLLSSPVRRSIVDHLAVAVEGMTAAELAEHLGLHVTTVRFHVDQLVRVGMLGTRFVRAGVGRPRKVYSLPAQEAVRSAADAFEALSGVLAEAWPDAEGADQVSATEAGRRWIHRHMARPDPVPPPASTPGAWLTKLARPFDLLAQWGYQPELRTVDNTRCADFTLRDCPFLDMAAARPDVVCAVHHGILRGAMELEGEPSAEIAIRPFVGPRTCTVHITQGRNPRE